MGTTQMFCLNDYLRDLQEVVDLDCGSKGCHDDSAEAVDQSLDHQDTEVHNRLLQLHRRH